MSTFETVLGEMAACSTEQGICLLEFTGGSRVLKELKDICQLFNGLIQTEANSHLIQLQKELEEYFSGERVSFDVPVEIEGTLFQKEVWNSLMKIPYGSTTSYKKQSLTLNKPEAIRAVASANGSNRIAIIIPCHRVIGEGGSLTGYAGGLHRKRWLLDHEARVQGTQAQASLF